MLNKHWPEPIEVNQDEGGLSNFYVENIRDMGHAADLQNKFGKWAHEVNQEDKDGYTILDRTAYRLERCYNACAGLNIQSDTKLKDVIQRCIDEMDDGSGNAPLQLIRDLQVLLSEQIVQGE